MVAENLITTAVLPLRTSDSGKIALAAMEDFNVRHLPIVNDQQLLGVISEDDILIHNIKEPVGSYELSLTKASVRTTDHLYEVMRLLAEHQLTVIPVVDAEGNYRGMISLEDVLNFFAKTAAFSDSGSIVVLEFQRHSYSLAEIARLVEAENASILSTFVTSDPEASTVEVTLKINRQDIHNILNAFQRFGYEIKAAFNEEEYLESLQDRYQALMNYLNV
ncbi:MAG: CBS domain-containing protein [Saprospiraceae bacterium]|jgi:CBS domain-containing protein|nr:CBS domain-containing protein [Saprospirales bacterium]RME11041.1 MAG: CBS domain-containing protein [Bacteroidota bacterium]